MEDVEGNCVRLGVGVVDCMGVSEGDEDGVGVVVWPGVCVGDGDWVGKAERVGVCVDEVETDTDGVGEGDWVREGVDVRVGIALGVPEVGDVVDE